MPLAGEPVRLHGLRELHQALKRFGSEESKRLDRELLAGGEIIAALAANRFSAIDSTEAAGLAAKTRGFGRVVVARVRTKNRRGDFGSLIMRRALLPARSEGIDTVVEHVDRMLGRLAGEEGF